MRDSCADCLFELATQLATIFITAIVVNNLLEVLVPVLLQKWQARQNRAVGAMMDEIKVEKFADRDGKNALNVSTKYRTRRSFRLKKNEDVILSIVVKFCFFLPFVKKKTTKRDEQNR